MHCAKHTKNAELNAETWQKSRYTGKWAYEGMLDY